MYRSPNEFAKKQDRDMNKHDTILYHALMS